MSQKYILGRIAQNRAKATKYIVTESAVFFVLILLQTTLFARFRVFGAIPDLCYAGVILIAWFCGKEPGAVTGIAAGFVLEALGSTGIAILPVCYLFCGYLCGYFTRAIIPRRFTAFLVVIAAAIPARAAITLIYMSLTYSNLRLVDVFVRNILPEMLGTAIALSVLYLPFKLICRWMAK